MTNNTGNLYLNTTLRNGGRKAGMGILYDDYGEESYGCKLDDYISPYQVCFPSDSVKPEELNGPVICYKEGKNDQT